MDKQQESIRDIQDLRETGLDYDKRGYYQKARDCYNQALKLAKDLTSTDKICHELLCDINLDISMTYCRQCCSKEAKEHCSEAEDSAQKLSDDVRVAKCFDQYAEIKIIKQLFDDAMANLQISLDLKVKALGDDHVDISGTYRAMGKIYWHRMQLGKALKMFDKCMNLRQRFLDENDLKIGELYSDLAELYSSDKKYPQALSMFQKSLSLRLKTIGRDNLEGARIYCGLAWINFNWYHKFKDVTKDLDRALKWQLAIEGPDGINVAQTYYVYACYYRTLKKMDKAVSFCIKSLKIRLKLLEENHSSIAESLILLGHLHYDENNFNVARMLYTKALTKITTVFGADNLLVANTSDWIAVAYSWQSEVNNALSAANRSKDIRTRLLGNRNKYVAYSHATLGHIFSAQGDFDKALLEYQQSLQMLTNLKSTHVCPLDIAQAYDNIADIYDLQNKFEDDIDTLKESLQINIKAVGINTLRVASVYHYLAMAYSKLNKFDEALQMHRKCLDIQIHLLGKKDDMVAETYGFIGKVYWSKNDYDNAIKYIKVCLETKIKLYGEMYPTIGEIRGDLEQLHRKKHRYFEADKMKAKASDIKRYFRRCRRSGEPILDINGNDVDTDATEAFLVRDLVQHLLLELKSSD